jgi:DNA-binding NtrC family response regulator
MLRERDSTQNFILHGLDATLATQLCDAVAQPGRTFHTTVSTLECISVAEKHRADVVFCNSDRSEYQRLLDAIGQKSLQVPVVVVSRIPETSEWLDAIEAGATDYCAAPFEHQHISWLVQSALLAGQRAAMAIAH